MGQLTKEPFRESCCDGGATSDGMSCQPCGCDPGADHLCERHAREHREVIAEIAKSLDVSSESLMDYAVESVGIQAREDVMKDTVPAFLTGMTVTLDKQTSVTAGTVPTYRGPGPAWTEGTIPWTDCGTVAAVSHGNADISFTETFERGVEMAERQEMQKFETGATRNDTGDKFDYEGFLHPEVLHAFGQYMHLHRRQRDGSLRDSDNWQRGIPFAAYTKSLVRHVIDLWRMERGFSPTNPDTGAPHTKEELCCAIMFNVMGYLKELLDPSSINRTKKEPLAGL